jgi:hypothetical protein
MVNNTTNINKTNNHLLPWTIYAKKKRPWHIQIEIQIMAWDRHENVAVLSAYNEKSYMSYCHLLLSAVNISKFYMSYCHLLLSAVNISKFYMSYCHHLLSAVNISKFYMSYCHHLLSAVNISKFYMSYCYHLLSAVNISKFDNHLSKPYG